MIMTTAGLECHEKGTASSWKDDRNKDNYLNCNFMKQILTNTLVAILSSLSPYSKT